VSAFTQVLEDGIVTLTLDVPGEPVNILGTSMLREFTEILDGLELATDVKGIVIRSGKPDNFIAGADIKDFLKIRSALEGETLSRAGQAVLDRVAALPMPVVAAVHGACLGGGLELVLACRYRVASDDAKTVFGVPEVKLGLIPGAGGTQRLPRLVGLATALDLIVTGRSLRARRALAAGLVDEVVPAAIVTDVARRAALALSAGTLKPRRRGISIGERLLRPLIFRKARRAVAEKTGGHYPAPLRGIDAVERGTALRLAEGLKLEAELFGALAVSDASRALVSVFFATQEIKKNAGYPEGTTPRPVRKLGVLGAGLMGGGIAAVAADVGVPVRLRDTTLAALGRGLRFARDGFEERRRRGSLSRLDLEKRIDRIAPSLDYSGLRRADLVIEAVFEDLEIKRKVLAEVEAVIGDAVVFASNTSSLPICEIARDARHKNRVLGMHFFSPVEKMPLLEVIVTKETEARATATAVGFGRRLGKHVIVVRDGPGFYTTRVLAPYMNEAARLLEEGAAVEDVDAAAVAFGFPVGPITLLDEVGIDVGAKVAKVLHQHFGDRIPPPISMARVVDDGRLGRKNKRGFYVYNGRKRVDASVYELLPGGTERRLFDAREIQDRLVFAFLAEAVLCLEEGILRSPTDGDVGAIFGLGFPPFLGGPFRYLDHLGARFATEILERQSARYGPRFAPPPSLVEKARSGGSFHAS
jgi:3-hydroxyacyl-CoA dehydrogenase/enoyl-CoA hydratase/3-hydroxybutyryl-CoA epimerase